MAFRKLRDGRISRLGKPSGDWEPGEPQRHSNFWPSTLFFFITFVKEIHPGDLRPPWENSTYIVHKPPSLKPGLLEIFQALKYYPGSGGSLQINDWIPTNQISTYGLWYLFLFDRPGFKVAVRAKRNSLVNSCTKVWRFFFSFYNSGSKIECVRYHFRIYSHQRKTKYNVLFHGSARIAQSGFSMRGKYRN